MMRLPTFRYRAPRTLEEASVWLAESPDDMMVVAGGSHGQARTESLAHRMRWAPCRTEVARPD